MGERLGASGEEKGVQIGTYTPEEVEGILAAYRDARSCLRASLVASTPCSPATVSRVVREAVKVGILDPLIKRGVGDSKLNRQPIFNALENHPGATMEEVARITGVSQSTVYRAKRGK